MLKMIIRSFTRLLYGDTKMVILIRTDIKMGKGKIASQAAHAAVSLYQSSLQNRNPYLQPWFNSGQAKIVLKVDKNATEILDKTFRDATELGFTACKIVDAGRTQVDSGTITAVGIGPCKTEDVDRITKDFHLL